jgi:hypothetical protein
MLTEKYKVDAGAAHATTIGLLAGAANTALLIRPTETYDAQDVVGLLFLGGALGAGGGFVYGQHAELTSGQSLFLGNAVLLGTATAALSAIAGSRNSTFDNWENATLAIGLDAGIVAGAAIAPHLDWSPRRSKVVHDRRPVGRLRHRHPDHRRQRAGRQVREAAGGAQCRDELPALRRRARPARRDGRRHLVAQLLISGVM